MLRLQEAFRVAVEENKHLKAAAANGNAVGRALLCQVKQKLNDNLFCELSHQPRWTLANDPRTLFLSVHHA